YLGFTVPGSTAPGGTIQAQAIQRVITPAYFAALRLRHLEGRLLAESDTETTEPVMVVDRAFAERYLGGRAGRQHLRLALAGKTEWTIVGVVETVIQDDIATPPEPEFFVSMRQAPLDQVRASDRIILIRTARDPAALTSTTRAVLQSIDPNLAFD